MRGVFKFAAVAVTAIGLIGCAQDAGNKEIGGTLLGAAGGGLLGSQFGSGSGQLAATAAGVFLGALLGQQVGESLDKADQAYASRAYSQSLETAPSGQTTVWHNPDSGHSGTYTPTRTYQTAEGQYCREFQQTVEIGGEKQSAYGTACRQPDGTWKIISTN
ncbi:MAG: hypothetical protein CMM50_11135 [Rhodospirillaceae bacterium]|nr:hypothetical protein [Rhodospirillaceae bacterium]